MLASNPDIQFDNTAGMLSDSDIRKYWRRGIFIFSSGGSDLSFDLDKQLQYGSIDLHFRHECKRFKLGATDVLTYEMTKGHKYTQPFELERGQKLIIQPGEMIITTTLETVQLSEEFAGIVTGRSSIARMGVMVHCCQEFINPGHGQPIPLQIINLSPCTVALDMTACICQLVLFKLKTPASGKYKDGADSKYAHEIGPENSKIYQDIDVSSSAKRSVQTPIKLWKKFTVYTLPFLPTLIMLTVITPFYNSNIQGQSIGDFLSSIKDMPSRIVIGVMLLMTYVIIKRSEQK